MFFIPNISSLNLVKAEVDATLAQIEAQVGSYVDDAGITSQVKSRFAEDPKVSAMAIKVETLKGAVQLSGFAKSSSERANAEAIAKDVPGVTGVINNIAVRP